MTLIFFFEKKSRKQPYFLNSTHMHMCVRFVGLFVPSFSKFQIVKMFDVVRKGVIGQEI